MPTANHAARERLPFYIAHAPFALSRLHYDRDRQMFRPLMSKVEKELKAADPDDFSLEKYSQYMTGYSTQRERYRFVYWCDDRKPEKPLALELYDHEKDPDENVNIAVDKANAELVKKLTQQWRDGWHKAGPK